VGVLRRTQERALITERYIVEQGEMTHRGMAEGMVAPNETVFPGIF